MNLIITFLAQARSWLALLLPRGMDQGFKKMGSVHGSMCSTDRSVCSMGPLVPYENTWKKCLSGLGIKHMIVFILTDILSKTAGLVSFFAWAARKLRVKLWLLTSKCVELSLQAFCVSTLALASHYFS